MSMSSENGAPLGQALVIGAGAWGSNVIRTLNSMGALAAICESSDARRAELTATMPQTPIYGRVADMLAAHPLLPVFVTTPPFTHVDVAEAVLRDGRDVFVEKPMTVSTDEAVRLVELADNTDRILMVGHLLLYNPAVETLKSRLAELGSIHYLHFQRLNLGRVRREENALWSFAPHDIAVMLHLLEEWPDAVSCTGSGFVNPEVEDVAWMQLRFPSGRLASIQVGWLEPQRVRTLKIVGEEACAIIDELAPSPLTIVRQTVDADTLKTEVHERETVALGEFEPLRRECTHFLECVRDRVQPRSPGLQGLAVVHILQSGTESLRQRGEWIKVEHHEQFRTRVGASRA